nr:60S ribosomal protein L39-like isoform X1 [Chlorocebus sabaeus]
MGDPKANLVTSHAGVGPTAPGPQLRGAGPPGLGRGQGGACHQGNRPPSIRARRLDCAQRGNRLRTPVRGEASRRLRDPQGPCDEVAAARGRQDDGPGSSWARLFRPRPRPLQIGIRVRERERSSGQGADFIWREASIFASLE